MAHMSEWTRVEDGLPDDREKVRLYNERINSYHMGCIIGESWFTHWHRTMLPLDSFTHWAPLNPPKDTT